MSSKYNPIFDWSSTYSTGVNPQAVSIRGAGAVLFNEWTTPPPPPPPDEYNFLHIYACKNMYIYIDKLCCGCLFV